MDLKTIKLESAGAITTLTLAAPETRNAINVTMVKELETVLHHLEDVSKDRIVVVRGSGGVFSSGIDLRDFPAEEKPDIRGFNRWEKACRALERLSKVTIAAVDGECAGGGLQLALTCDVRVATTRSYFELHEVRDGFLPGMGTFRLSKFIGLGRARRLTLTGRRLDTEEALRIGLIDHVCPEGGLDEAVRAAIAEFGEIHTDAVELTRRLFDESYEISYEDFVGCFLAAQHRAIQTPAFREKVREAHQRKIPRPRRES
jgi:enoyl-CoA hydratase